MTVRPIGRAPTYRQSFNRSPTDKWAERIVMPLYQCYSPAGLLTKSMKAQIADEITTIHTDATGAPELYVNVLFHEIAEGDCFVARKESRHSYLWGAIRRGRDLETRQTILRQLSEMWTRLTGQSEGELMVVLAESDPANAMEAGLILPESGQEQQWLDENRARLTQLGVTA
jgi:phenylpyruvate tautomerase PptA (4-oxalocrotonate tautomerase family)